MRKVYKACEWTKYSLNKQRCVAKDLALRVVRGQNDSRVSVQDIAIERILVGVYVLSMCRSC